VAWNRYAVWTRNPGASRQRGMGFDSKSAALGQAAVFRAAGIEAGVEDSSGRDISESDDQAAKGKNKNQYLDDDDEDDED
jgi:hypothetical protein